VCHKFGSNTKSSITEQEQKNVSRCLKLTRHYKYTRKHRCKTWLLTQLHPKSE